MKKRLLLVLCLCFLSCNFIFGQKSAAKANRVTALRCLKLAENCLMGKDFQNAYNQAVLGISYDNSISDLNYVMAASEYNLGTKKNQVIADLEKAFELNDWTSYTKNQARILLADLYSDTNRCEDSLKVLDETPLIYSADAEVIRIKDYYRMGTDESWNEARLKINASRRIYPDDERFPILFFVFENLRKNFSEVYKIDYEIPEIVYTIADAYISKLPDYNSKNQDYELLAANFASADVKNRLVKAIEAKSKNLTPFLVIAALDEGIYSQETAFTKFVQSLNGETDILTLELFLSKITEEAVKNQVSEYLTNYEGKILVDENLDLQCEVIISYKNGRPESFTYDYNNDGLFEYEAVCDLGSPKTVFANNKAFSLSFENFPEVTQLKLIKDDILYNFATGDYSYVPFVMKKNEVISTFNVDFFIPCMFSNPDLLISEDLNTAADSISLPNSERENGRVIYQTYKGNVVNAKFYENNVQYGFADFENGVPFLRILDNNLDGSFETSELYKSVNDEKFSEAEKESLKQENDRNDSIFAGLVSDVYLAKLSVDANLNSHNEFEEEYGPFNSKTINWDNDDNGILDSKYIRHPKNSELLEEEVIFYNGNGNEIVNINLNNGVPVKMIAEDHEVMVYAGKNKNFYWIDTEGNENLESKILGEVKGRISQGVIGVYEIEGKRFSVIKVEDDYFCRIIPPANQEE